MGKYGSKWLGDNYSEFRYMGYSVTGVMMMNIFGIPFAGADICGFLEDTTPELCARWTVLGNFYTFSRNHNSIFLIPQEPYAPQFQVPYEYSSDGTPITYSDIMIQGIKNRYHLIKYYYTYLYFLSAGTSQVASNNDATFYKPLFFEFPS